MSEMSLRSVKKFITKLGAHYVHMTGYVLHKLPRPFEELLRAAKTHRRTKTAAAAEKNIRDIPIPFVFCSMIGSCLLSKPVCPRARF